MAETKRTILERLDRNVARLVSLLGVDKPLLQLSVGPIENRQITQGPTQMLTLTDIQHCALTIEPDDAAGNPVVVTGVPQWSVSDPTVATIQPAPDGMSADLASTGKLGNAQVTVSLVTDTATLTGLLDVTVVTSAPTTFKITPGTPADK